ncbi:hypothetical protein GDO86_020575 [Hymenochirus boettgeri]|uniref:Uncharacterized protein n=1 Tax=Hymenochirus boettgeri TaxID=247094 RepID=A0A8T2ILG1_9PIPI|nr:hypothetical protein GDO86_020575 [Hymenochirus boettgeri]
MWNFSLLTTVFYLKVRTIILVSVSLTYVPMLLLLLVMFSQYQDLISPTVPWEISDALEIQYLLKLRIIFFTLILLNYRRQKLLYKGSHGMIIPIESCTLNVR